MRGFMRWLRATWTRLRGGEPCYVCGRAALNPSFPRYEGFVYVHDTHLTGVSHQTDTTGGHS